MTNEEMKDTGIPENMTAEQEYDLLEGLLAAADYVNELKPIRIERNGKHMFTFHVHAVSEKDKMDAHRKATTYAKNPAGAHLPQIEKDTPPELFKSWLIFIATSDEDKQNIWNNKDLKKQLNVLRGVETIDLLLKAGEKDAVMDVIAELSGFGIGSNSITTDEFAKN